MNEALPTSSVRVKKTGMNYWLLKSEPDVYSIDQLERDGKTSWNGVRNFQARNVLKTCKKDDLVLIYHSNIGKAVVGIGKIVKEAYPDIDEKRKGDWVQVDVAFVTKFKTAVTLESIKQDPNLQNLPLLKQSRLSCMPVPETEFKIIRKLGE
jgi:predicted RNA-binding protein with PUA-like domain